MDKDLSSDPIDFSALDPTLDGSFDARIAAIVRDAAPAADVMTQLGSWARPALAAAAVIAALAAIPLLRATGANSSPRAASAADILGIPAPVARLARAQTVDVTDLAEAFATESRHGR